MSDDLSDDRSSSVEPRPQDDDVRIEDALAGYIDRLNAGGRVSPEEVHFDHPTLGGEIVERLRAFAAAGGAVLDGLVGPDGTNPFGETAPLGAAHTLGDYKLRRQIGRGGMGVVYEAWQGSLDRQVALKVLPPGVAADTKSYTRFLREAQIAAKIRHPNVVAVHGFGVEAGTPYYAMEYVEGETLAALIARRREAGEIPSPEECYRAAEAFAGVAEGLDHAHKKGVIHRDLKPSNLIFDREGKLRILDFGLARLEGQETLTGSGDFLGTPQYMSPEQARRKQIPIDHRTDIYSLGATMYEALTLRPPFRGKDHADTLSQIIERDPNPPSRINPRVPRDLETIVLKCLRKEAGERYGTAEALGQDLRRFVRGDLIEARTSPVWHRIARKLWRARLRVTFVALSILLLCSLLFLVLEHFHRGQRIQEAIDKEQSLDGLVGEAISDYADALRIDPAHEFQNSRLTKALLERGQLAEARELLRELIRRQMAAPEPKAGRERCLKNLGHLHHAMAEILLKLGDSVGAAKAEADAWDSLPKEIRNPAVTLSILSSCVALASKDGSLSEDERWALINTHQKRIEELTKVVQDRLDPPYAPRKNLFFLDLQPKANVSLTEKANVSSIDQFYGALHNNLEDLPKGDHLFAGVTFRIAEGLIKTGKTKPQLPGKVMGIQVNQKVERLYILHGTEGKNEIEAGTAIGSYDVNYKSGARISIPIVYGVDVREWWGFDPKTLARGRLAWIGTNQLTRVYLMSLRLFVTVWENPMPDQEVTSIDSIATSPETAPFCVALTVE